MKRISLLLFLFACAACHTTKPTAVNAISKPPVMTADNYAYLKEKLEQGIDFIASGQEPFWSLEIDFAKQMHFKTAAGFEMTAPVPEGVKATDAAVTRYRAQTAAGELIVQLRKSDCINSMSGKQSAYTVTVDTKKNSATTYTTFKGCGDYTVDYRINDIWVLERINNNTLKAADFTKGLPQLEFNLAQQKVFGHTGCNNLNGAIEVQGKKISFGMLITTRMACPDMDFETRFINSLQRNTLAYNIDKMKLQLHINADAVYTFRKVD